MYSKLAKTAMLISGLQEKNKHPNLLVISFFKAFSLSFNSAISILTSASQLTPRFKLIKQKRPPFKTAL